MDSIARLVRPTVYAHPWADAIRALQAILLISTNRPVLHAQQPLLAISTPPVPNAV